MKYVKIKAENYKEAMMKLKTQYGNDAIPISHKYVKEGGILNSRLFARTVVEVTAGVHEKKIPARSNAASGRFDVLVGEQELPGSRMSSRGAGDNRESRNSEVTVDKLVKSIDSLNDSLGGVKRQQPAGKDASEHSEENFTLTGRASTKFEKEFSELKDTLNKLLAGQEQKTVNSVKESEEPALKKFYDLLRRNDFDSDERAQIMKEVRHSVSRDDVRDEYKIEKSLKELLKSRIVTTGPIEMKGKKIIMFVGPTGVGKTTTIAKLGALHSLREGKKVVFITIDNYRIAATEQLKKYAEIMKIPVYAINDQKEFKSVISREKADLILVDTSGRSHRNQLKIAEMKSYADSIEYDFEKILCVSANTKKDDLHDVFRAFDIMNFDSIVITKVDETSFIGNVVDIADKYHKPISYFTNGQEVPNDIEVAESGRIVDMMIGDINKQV